MAKNITGNQDEKHPNHTTTKINGKEYVKATHNLHIYG